ncbi:MAG: SGNH/GDSL hydrolase family protein, partial [Thermodesulfobacteriota bacterium]
IKDELEQQSQAVDLVNLGVLGATIDVIEVEVQDLISTKLQPELITIWSGSNDVIAGNNPDDFETVLESILLQLSEETSALIVIANIPDLTELPHFVDNPNSEVTLERIKAFNSSIELQASMFGIPVVDLFSEEITENLVSSDWFHPSNEGHVRIAELFIEIILP